MAASFNDPPQPTTSTRQLFPTNNDAPPDSSLNNGDNTYVPRPKRIACVVCRRRKLKCDGKKPSCGTCSRLGHECAYDEVRRKSGPKRGYVKQLEARLAQVETLLKGNDESTAQTSSAQPQEHDFSAPISMSIGGPPSLPEIPSISHDMENSIAPLSRILAQSQANETYSAGPGPDMWNDFEWDMISLGLEEPLPTQDVVDELDRLYFEKIHPAEPIIHPPRYFAAMQLAPHARPPVALRYIMWALAAAVSEKYDSLHPHFYQRARKYAETEEMKHFGEHIVNLSYCQAWLLMSMYEFRMMFFPRAWLSVGKGARLALMIGLNRLDGVGLDVKQCLTPPKDWTEKEERRRVFWTAFCIDRYASAGTGWPMVIDEGDIMTNLPATEESFINSKPQQTARLADVMSGEGISALSSFGSVVLLACFIGRELLHLHRPGPQDNESDLNGEFWKRHRAYDNLLLHSALSAPSHLRLPTGIADPNVIFWNMGIHSATICLHQAAIFKAEKNKLANSIVMESKRRCIVAADQISSVMKMISHMDLSTLNPFMSFAVFVAGRVFVQYLKSRPDDSTVQSSLQFIVSALKALKSKNPLTESFLAQLEVDVDGNGLHCSGNAAKKDAAPIPGFSKASNIDSVECSPLFSVRDAQSSAAIETPGAPTACIGNAARESNRNGAASLPNRHKRTAQQTNPNTTCAGGNIPSFTNSPDNISPGIDTAGQRVMEMDFSSDFSVSEKINPPSDHPTPSTMNSSSNTSYSVSKADQSSPQKSQLPSYMHDPTKGFISSLKNPTQPDPLMETAPQNQLGDISSLASQLFPTSSGAPMGSATVDPAFSMSMAPSWDVGDTQTSTAGNTNTTAGGIGSFDETQWAQLLSGSSWGAWPQES